MKKQKIEIKKRGKGKLFDVKYLVDGWDGVTFTVVVNTDIADYVGWSEKKFESYLRKSFRHFYNLDKKLKERKGKGRLPINKL